jgi:subtilisin family serine protease
MFHDLGMEDANKMTTKVNGARIRITGAILLLVLTIGILSWPQSSAAQMRGSLTPRSQSRQYRSGEIIARFESDEKLDQFNQRHGTFAVRRMPNSDYYLLRLQPGAEMTGKLGEMSADLGQDQVGPNYEYLMPEVRQTSQGFIDQTSQAFIDQTSQAFIDGSAPANYYGQPTVTNLRLTNAHQSSLGAGVKVAVIDTGIDQSHPVFAGRIVGPAYDFVSDDVDPNDEPGGAGYGHGTFVAGLVALTAPQAMIMPLRAFDNQGQGSTFNIARAIRYAVDNGAQVINMSFGMLESDPAIRDAIDYAYGRALMIAAAGNEGANLIHFPASMSGKTIAVSSTDANDVKSSFANYNSKVDVVAPGSNVYSAYPDNRWATWSGTSFSAAMISGEAALMLALRPHASHVALRMLIISAGPSPYLANPAYFGQLGLARVDFRSAIDYTLFLP